MSKNDPVSHPAHYTQYEHEVIELTEKLGFCLGNAVKYILRAPYKGHEAEDLKKARWYVNRIIERHLYEAGTFITYEKAHMELLESFNVPLVYELVFTATNSSQLNGIVEKLDRMILEAENRELKKQLQEAKNQAFLAAAKRTPVTTPCSPGDDPRSTGDLIPTKIWMTGYAI